MHPCWDALRWRLKPARKHQAVLPAAWRCCGEADKENSATDPLGGSQSPQEVKHCARVRSLNSQLGPSTAGFGHRWDELKAFSVGGNIRRGGGLGLGSNRLAAGVVLDVGGGRGVGTCTICCCRCIGCGGGKLSPNAPQELRTVG